MAEWLKAPVSKTGIGETLSRVQIPLSPLRVLLEVWPSGYTCLGDKYIRLEGGGTNPPV